MIVADTHLVANLLIEGELTVAARRVWRKDPDWVLPPIWRVELLSILVAMVRSGDLELEAGLEAWAEASQLFHGAERQPGGERVLLAASRYDLPAHDAHFVVLAEELGVPLVTGSPAVLAACPAIAQAIEAFAPAPFGPGS